MQKNDVSPGTKPVEELKEAQGSIILRKLLAQSNALEAAKRKVHGIAASHVGHITKPLRIDFSDVPETSLQTASDSNLKQSVSLL